MGILRPVIQSSARTVFDARHDIAFSRAVGSEFVGNHHSGCLTLSVQQLSHQTFGCLGITAALHKHINNNKAILIDDPPQPVLLAANGDEDFIEIPFVAKLSG